MQLSAMAEGIPLQGLINPRAIECRTRPDRKG